MPPVKPSVTIQQATNITINSAILVAALVPNEDGTTVAFEYKTQSVATWSSVAVLGTYSGKVSVQVISDLSSLASNTVYVYRAKATNKAGSTTSSENQFQTGAIAPGIAIKEVTNLNLTSVTLNAKVVGKDGPTSVTFEYKLRDEVNAIWTSMPISGTFSGQDSISVSLNLTNLPRNTRYFARAKATNAGGQTISAEADFWTYEVSDIDGNFYHTVTIGNQVWMAENLKTTKFRDGTPIPNKTENRDWSDATGVPAPAYCWYNNDISFKNPYGALYNWYVASDPRIAPTGYHMPTGEEFRELTNFFTPYAGIKLKAAGSAAGWQYPSQADNSSNFSAFPAGGRGDQTEGGLGTFDDWHRYAYFWSRSQFGPGGEIMSLSYNSSNANTGRIVSKSFAGSIRCLKDK